MKICGKKYLWIRPLASTREPGKGHMCLLPKDHKGEHECAHEVWGDD